MSLKKHHRELNILTCTNVIRFISLTPPQKPELLETSQSLCVSVPRQS